MKSPKLTKLQKLRKADSIVEQCYTLALKHFKDEFKADLWFIIPNSFLDKNMFSPIELIQTKGSHKLLNIMKQYHSKIDV